MRIMLVAGARPNFMKIAPVLAAFDDHSADTILVHTGQHYNPLMSDVFFDELGIRKPDHHLEAGSGTHAEQTAVIMVAFEPLVERLHPDVIAVPDDVNGTMACALVGAKAGAPVAHIGAGLCSRDWSMPEEINRVVADRTSDFLFASSPDAVDNLQAEGYRDDQIHLVGNVTVDSLLANVERARQRPVLKDLGLDPHGYGVVTLHRPSNVDDPSTLELPTGSTRRSHRNTSRSSNRWGISTSSPSNPKPRSSSPTPVAYKKRPPSSAPPVSRCARTPNGRSPSTKERTAWSAATATPSSKAPATPSVDGSPNDAPTSGTGRPAYGSPRRSSDRIQPPYFVPRSGRTAKLGTEQTAGTSSS